MSTWYVLTVTFDYYCTGGLRTNLNVQSLRKSMNYRESRKDRKKSVYRKVGGIGERFVKLHVHTFSNSSLWLP